MTKEFIEKEVNNKILKLFYKLIELTPFMIRHNTFCYKYQEDVIEMQISSYGGSITGYELPSFSNPNFDLDFTEPINSLWQFTLIIPCAGSGFSKRYLNVFLTDELEFLEVKKKLLLKQQQYELTFLDKYFINTSEGELEYFDKEDLPL